MLISPRIRRAALAAGLALAALPAGASADSIVFIKDGDVWLANGDGSGSYQVTLDGTAEHPYRVPAQADDGTIVASRLDEIVRMRQNGEVLSRIDPEPLVNSVGHPIDGPPVNLAVSPDGSRIAYSLVGYECPVGADCMARSVTAFTAADALTPASQWGSLHRRNPSFVTNSRTLVFGGYAGQVNVHDLGDPVETHWFDDYDVYGQAEATDLGDGELNRQGSRLAAIRSYGPDAHLIWYAVGRRRRVGQAAGGPRRPSARAARRRGWPVRRGPPTASGSRSRRRTACGRCARRRTARRPRRRCSSPCASQPDWGPALVAPGPRPGGGGSGPGGAGGQPASGRPSLTVKRARAKAIARKGLALTIACPAACAVKADLLVDKRSARRLRLRGKRPAGTATRTLAATGSATLSLKPAERLRARFARLKGAKLTVRVTVTDGAGATQVLRRRV